MINQSYLLGLFGASSSTAAGGGASAIIPPKKTQPTAPWSSPETASKPSDLVRSALAGRRLINETAVDLDMAGASPDYTRLFALYQGLETLSALADRANERSLSALELSQTAKRFSSGLQEISDWLSTTKFQDIDLVQGVSSTKVKTTAGVEKTSTTFVSQPVHSGAISEPVAAFAGDVRFTMTVGEGAAARTIQIDLADMGDTPRTFGAVTEHINGKLADAGVATRVSYEQIPGEPKTVKSGDKTITLPAGPDQWAFEIQGAAGEAVSFAADAVSDAIYVTQGVGAKGADQLLKFQSDGGAAPAPSAAIGDPFAVEGQVGRATLPEGVETVRVSAVAPDGTLWVVADMASSDPNQPIKGQRDVALMKYDSAGNLLSTKLLGAASDASGFAIAIDADGRVAVAGSVTGALEPGKTGADATVADSFVTVFDAAGAELWTQRRGAKAADEATAVSFGPDGQVYVAGRAKSAMPGTVAQGGWDSYLQTFTEQQQTPIAPKVGVSTSTLQFGSVGDDSVQAMTVSGADLYTAGVENGRIMVRQFTLGADGSPTLAATRDLGLAQGSIAGIAVADGRVILTGQTENAALDVGTPTNAHAGGSDAFVAVLSGDLQPSAGDRLTYVGGAGDDSAADVAFKDGKVWITGSNRAAAAGEEDPSQGYLMRMDPETGATEWSQTWTADNGQARPATIAVASGGASVLDRLGLPQGTISQTNAKQLTQATALRVGDQFTVTPGNSGRAVTVEITAKDTLDTLAKKIVNASGRQLKVAVVTDKTAPFMQRLEITAEDNKAGAVISSGAPGKDALGALGLSPGLISPATDSKDKAETKKAFGLTLPNNLNLNSKESIKAAIEALSAAISTVRSAYKGLAPRTTEITNSLTGKGGSTAYYNTQAANFQAALDRLGGLTA